tara:strand:+ start:1990 stop:3312 length:1323 start_codon:yes stop_codon:yes gene_type:complete
MKFFLTFIFFIILSNCSFDNKTGIWQNTNEVNSKKDNKFKDFETLYTETKSFNTIIEPDNNLEIYLDPVQLNLKWTDEFFDHSNKLKNFSYKNLNELFFKSKKLSKHQIKRRILYDNQRVILTDDKGNIIVYSVENKKILLKFNFYKKKFKKNKKSLNIITENNIIYVADNLGYFYALDILNNKLIWAKNHKIPFRSNLKIKNDKIFLADINNSLLLVNKQNGEKIKIIPTEETAVKNDFINSLVSNENSFFYLNTYGSLYSISKKGNIKWFINLNRSLSINPSNLFYSNPLVLNQDKLIVSTDLYLYILDSNNGSILSKIAITSLFRPLVSRENLFLVTKNNLLICISLESNKIVYSLDISKKVADYLDTKKKSLNIKSLAIINNDIFLFLNNSYLVKFSSIGKIKEISKLPSKLSSFPIFINESIIYLNNKNKLVLVN